MAEPRLRRSLLITPGNRPERLRKAAGYGADCVVLDLEDGVPPAAKLGARSFIAQVLRDLRNETRNPGHPAELCVRINSLASGWGEDDLAALPLALIDSIMLPKVESVAGLREVEQRLERRDCDRGRERPLELVLSLETPGGILQALPIAQASARASALFFGSGDYSAATGSALTDTALLFARSMVAAAAGAARIQAIDAAYFQDVRDGEATGRDARAARELGFVGKLVFHPAQVAVVNQVFSPSAGEIDRAQRIVLAYREALAQGHGTALVDGVFVAIDLVEPAQRLLRVAAMVEALARRPDGSNDNPPT